MSQFKDLAVEGEAIASRPNDEHFADIVGPEPRYEEVPSLDNAQETKEKLIVNVLIAGKDTAEYYPNKTSARFIANRLGTNMQNWIGHRVFWKILEQKIAGNNKKVLYVDKVEVTPIKV